jgi:acetyl esterase/lipase
VKTIVSCLILVASFAASFAHAAAVNLHLVADVPYLESGRTEKLDLYLPTQPAAGTLSPAFVWIHGGGFTLGDKAQIRDVSVSTALASAGYVVASVNYKLGAGSFPTNIGDCKNAVRFLRAHAAEYHLDPNRIAVGGGSAGGYLALMVGFTEGTKLFDPHPLYKDVSSKVCAVVDFYGPVDFKTRRQCTSDGRLTGRLRSWNADSPTAFGEKEADDRFYRLISAIGYVTNDAPPVLICQGSADPEVDYLQSVELANVLGKHEVAHELYLLDGIGHAFDLKTWRKKLLPRDLRPVVLTFLAKHQVATAIALSTHSAISGQRTEHATSGDVLHQSFDGRNGGRVDHPTSKNSTPST